MLETSSLLLNANANTSKLNVELEVCGGTALSETVTVKLVADNNAVGFPVINPLVVLKVNPIDDKLTVLVIAYNNIP